MSKQSREDEPSRPNFMLVSIVMIVAGMLVAVVGVVLSIFVPLNVISSMPILSIMVSYDAYISGISACHWIITAGVFFMGLGFGMLFKEKIRW